ncbi:FG-GAP repeat protein [Alcanivorax sp. ZXX171]|nr:FG-GAP repeat protein [Alcanivorax sp. ZXX171]
MNSCRHKEMSHKKPASPACWPRGTRRILLVGSVALGLAACSGGGGERRAFTDASMTADSEPKQIQLNWVFDDGTPDHYTVEVNPDGNSAFTQADLNGDGTIDNQDEIAGGESSIAITLPLHLTDFNNGRYRIVAYDDRGAEIGASTSINLISVVVNRLIGYVKASNTDVNDYFGDSVALAADGNTLVVGANSQASKATGVDGDQSDNSEIEAGAVYVFTRTGTTRAQQAYLKAPTTELNDYFGISVVISDDDNTLAAAASGENGKATGINGDQSDNTVTDAGAVYLY